MILPERFYRINSWTCFAFGLLLNGTLLVLLAKYTTAEMATFRLILMRTTLITIGWIVTARVTQLVIVTHSSYTVTLSVGPLWWLPQPYNFMLIALDVGAYIFYNSSLSMTFVIRYFNICWERNYGVRQLTVLLLTVSLPSAFSWALVLAKTGYVSSAEDEFEAKMRFFNDSAMDDTHRDYVIPFYRRPGNNLFARFMLIYNTVNYALIIFLAWRIYRHLMGMAGGMSGSQYRTLHLQLWSVLLFQSMTPVLLVCLPSMGLALAAVTGMKAQSVSVYFASVVAWESVLNPLIVMCVIQAFRQAIFGWLRKLRSVMLRQSTTTVLPAAQATIVLSHVNNKR